MRPLLLAFVLVAPALAAAQAPPRHPLLAQCFSNESGVRRWYHALQPAEQGSFDALYAEYSDLVRRHSDKNGDNWSHGWRGNFWTHYVNDTNTYGAIGGLFQTVSTWEDSRTKLQRESLPEAQREYARARKAAADAPGSARLADAERAARQHLEDLQEMASQQAGTCSDWAVDVKYAVSRVAQPHFSIETEIKTTVGLLGDSGSHMFAKACPKSGGACIILDPWKRGYPELATVAEESRGASAANSCFSVNKPVE
jgi:hypothetical protein